MNTHPILVIAFNRPEKLRMLLESLKASRPKKLLVAIDGPRPNIPADKKLVQETQEMLIHVTWECNLDTRFRQINMGLQSAYVDAVNWAISKHGRVTVIEDDVIAGPELVEYSLDALNRYQNESSIGHISGYNFVPREFMSSPNDRERLSIYPASYTWSTWDRAWRKFDPTASWGVNASLRELSKACGSLLSATMWKCNFSNAVKGRVNTWDYQWVSTLWQHQMKVVTPNRNLATYNGFDQGTHTWSGGSIDQQPVEQVMHLSTPIKLSLDGFADSWHSRVVFRESPSGLAEKLFASGILEARRRKRLG